MTLAFSCGTCMTLYTFYVAESYLSTPSHQPFSPKPWATPCLLPFLNNNSGNSADMRFKWCYGCDTNQSNLRALQMDTHRHGWLARPPGNLGKSRFPNASGLSVWLPLPLTFLTLPAPSMHLGNTPSTSSVIRKDRQFGIYLMACLN